MKKFMFICCVLFSLLVAGTAFASLYTITSDFEGSLSSYATVRVTLNDNPSGADTASITVTALNSYLIGGQNDAFALNVNGGFTGDPIFAAGSPANLEFIGSTAHYPGNLGSFNLLIGAGSMSQAVSTFTFTITGEWTDESAVLLGNASGNVAAAHILDPSNGLTFHASALPTPPEAVPIPPSVALFASGLLAVVGIGRKFLKD